MATCSSCGRNFPEKELTVVIDGYATGGQGYVKKEMCQGCVRNFMRGKSGIQIGGSGDLLGTGKKWWQFWK
jgi:hypothetical protein